MSVHSKSKLKDHFHNAIRKYGWENFKTEIILEHPNHLLGSIETYYILLLHANERHIGYNILTHAFDRTGIPHSEETKAKIRKTTKLVAKRGDEHYTRISGIAPVGAEAARIANTGKVRSQEFKDKISKAQKGRRNFWNEKKVKQIDKNTGEIIKVWDSIVEAGKVLAPSGCASGIRTVLHKRPNSEGVVQKTAFGYKWEFVES